MKYESITPAQVILSDYCTEIYMITRVTGELKLDEIRNAEGFVIPVGDRPELIPIETPKKELKAPIKSKIDHGKIVSLCQAGWKIADIADELRCSEQTVRNHLAKECPNDSDN